MPPVLRSPLAIACFALTAMGGVALDLWTKYLSVTKLDPFSGPYRFIPGCLEFEVVRNQGAVFGVGQGQRTLFVIVSACAILFLLFLFMTGGKKWFYQVLLGMLMAGVIGNMYDRVELGYVRDMIHVFPRWHHFFPYVFNVADSFLCVGVSLMVLYSFFSPEKPSHRKIDPL